MSADYVIIGHFKFVDSTIDAIRKLRAAGHENINLYSPLPNHELEDELYLNKPRSPVRRFTFLGGLTGCLCAFLMTCWMSLDWPLRTSAKTILSIPAFVVIGFECTILLGGIFTLLSMFHFSGIPNIFSAPDFRPNFTNDTFGLTVRVDKSASESIKKLFEQCGAGQVEVQYVR